MKDSKKQIISLFDIQKIIYGDKAKHWVKSGPTPPAHNTNLCDSGTQIDTLSKRIYTVIKGNQETPLILSAVLELLFINGCRISEILRIKGRDISKTGHIKIRGSKGSNDRIVLAAVHRPFWLSMRQEAEELGSIYSRFWFYREFKKRGISLNFGQGYKKAVTHAPRHIAIQSISKIDEGLQLTQQFIGHKSLKSTKHYAKSKNKRQPHTKRDNQ